jgi:hypothetical protein
MEASDYSASTSAGSNGSSTPSPVGAYAASHPASAHPEYPVLAAFVGGFILAKLLKAIGGGDDD